MSGDLQDRMQLLAQEGMRMICFTHDMNFAREAPEYDAYFHEFAVVKIGPPSQFFGDATSEPTRKCLAKDR